MIALAAALLLTALPAAPREYNFGQDMIRVSDLGVLSMLRDGKPLVSSAHLWLAGPGWKSTDQAHGAIQRVAVRGAEQWFTYRLTEPVSGKQWEVSEKVSPAEGGVAMTFAAHALAEMDVNELSLVVDLPVAAWSGKTALLWPGDSETFPPKPPADRHFAFATCTAVILAPGQGQVVLRPLQPRHVALQDSRVLGSPFYELFLQIIPSGTTHVKPGVEYTGGLTLLAEDPHDYKLPKPPSLKSTGPLAIRGVTMTARQVPQWSKFELGIDLSATYDNAFDPRQIDVSATFHCPDGDVREVPGFYYQGYRRELLDGACVLIPDGRAGWRVRFTPTAPGRYTFSVSARDRSGRVDWHTGSFECTAAAGHGFVRRSDDPHYFRYDDGKPYFPVGENLCWYGATARTYDYDKWLGKLHAAGANYVRIWMPSWAFGVEWGKPGVYRLDRAWEFDYVLDECQRLGIEVNLCLENFRTFNQDAASGPGPNPYDARNGGPCKTVHDFFTNPEAKAMFKRRLRYIVARWSYSPAIMDWELWNEINCVKGFEGYKSDVVAWTAEMADYLKQIDPNRHLTTNSLGSSYLVPALWRLREMDFTQMHGYYGWSGTAETRDMGGFVAKMLGLLRDYGKPYLFTEFGIAGAQPDMAELCHRDREGVHLHNGEWAAAMSGSAGGAMLWWWDSYVDPMNLYSRFTSLARYAADVPWTTAHLEPSFVDSNPAGLRVMALRGPGRVLFWAQNTQHTWWNVVQGNKIEPVANASVTLRNLTPGMYRLRLYDTWACRYILDEKVSPAAGTLKIPLGTVSRDIAGKVELTQ